MAAADINQKLCGTLNGNWRQLWIDAALKTVRCISVQPVGARLARNGKRGKER